MQEYVIDGRRFSTLEDFLKEVSKALIPNVPWARSLDAFDELLRGGLGTPGEGFRIRWTHHAESRKRLGYGETVRQLQSRLQRSHPTDRSAVLLDLEQALRNQGPTVFEWLIEIIGKHKADILLNEERVKMMDPVNVLSRGYSITRKNGKAVRDIADLNENEIIETQLFKGKITTVVKSKSA